MDYKIIELPRHLDRRGNLSVVENGIHIPFNMKRAFFIYDVPGGESRAGHAHHTLFEFIIAVGGSFTVHLDDGSSRESILLNKPYQGLLVTPAHGRIWLISLQAPLHWFWHQISMMKMITFVITVIL